MEPDIYLKKHHLLTYIDDAIQLLLSCKDEDSKTKPFELLTDYFNSVRNGSHIVFREYDFITATPHNRKSFVATLWQTYSGVSECREPMRIIELHSLFRLLCGDFPLNETEKVAKALKNTTSGVISFTDFIYAFQVTFYFDYFLAHLEAAYPSLLAGTYHPPIYPQFSSTNTVVVPLPPAPTSTITTSSQTDTLSSKNSASQTDSAKTLVNSGVLLEAALELCQRMEESEPGQSCPSQEALREVLSGADLLSLRDFVVNLSLSDRINSEIGALPSRK